MDAHGTLRPVDLATGLSSIRNQPGLRRSAERLNPLDLLQWDGITITAPARAVCFEMRYARSAAEAVVVLDMAAYADLVSIDEMTTYALAHPGWTGIPQCRDALRWADENSWSPRESRLRLIWNLAEELPPPVTNRPIFDLGGHHLGTPDLFEPISGLAVEYDGRLHLEGSRRASDLDRDALMRAHGIEILVFVDRHLRDATVVLQRLREARRRATRSQTIRSWTLDPPPWWQPTHTVALRRELTADQRARLLAHRQLDR